MTWNWNEMTGVEWCISDALILMERNEVTQCGLWNDEWENWSVVEGSRVWWYGVEECVETNKRHVKYEANVSELACDELSKIDC